MQIIDHGFFIEYAPEKRIMVTALHCRNEQGKDWYTIAHQKPKPEGRHFYMVHSNGKIAAHDTDPERMWPLNHRIVETDASIPDNRIWNGHTFTEPVT